MDLDYRKQRCPCSICQTLRGKGPWCPRCGKSLWTTRKGQRAVCGFTNDVCSSCDAEMGMRSALKLLPRLRKKSGGGS